MSERGRLCAFRRNSGQPTTSFGALGARVVDRELPLALGDDAWQGSGELASADHREALAEHVGALLGALAVGADAPVELPRAA